MNNYGSDGAAAAAAALGSGALLCWFLFVLLLVAATVYVYFRIIAKTGYSGWFALLMFVPIVNLGMILFLAFADWPVLQENRSLRARLGMPPGDYPGNYPGAYPGTGYYTPPYAPPGAAATPPPGPPPVPPEGTQAPQ